MRGGEILMKLQMIRLKKLSFMALATALVMLVMIAISPLFESNKAHAQLSTNARNLAGLIAVDRITSGAPTVEGVSNLGDLIVLEGLFGTGTQAQRTRDLAGLIAVNNVVGEPVAAGGIVGKAPGNSLGDLIVLNGLFGSGTTFNTNLGSLAGLVAVNNITEGQEGVGPGHTSLGDLIVLNGLFMDP